MQPSTNCSPLLTDAWDRQQTVVLFQQMPEIHYGHSLTRGHKEWIIVGKGRTAGKKNIQIRRRKWIWIGHSPRRPSSKVTGHAVRRTGTGEEEPRPYQGKRTVDDEVDKAGSFWRQIEKLESWRQKVELVNVYWLMYIDCVLLISDFDQDSFYSWPKKVLMKSLVNPEKRNSINYRCLTCLSTGFALD